MEIELYHHLTIFAYSLILGLGVGLIFDLFMILNHLLGIRLLLHKELSFNKFSTVNRIQAFFNRHYRFKKMYRYIGLIVSDILCALIVGMILSVFVFHANHGKLRWFLLVGVLAGILSYKISVGKLTKRLISAMIYIIAEGFYWLLMIVIKPLKLLFRIFKQIFRVLTRPVFVLSNYIRHKIYVRKTDRIENNLKVLIRMD